MLLSICIPTYNRARLLSMCLKSIATALTQRIRQDVEICISDNASTDETRSTIAIAQTLLPLQYRRSERNRGFARNLVEVVGMATGDYVWIIGDDDLILPGALERILDLLSSKTGADFFYLNTLQLALKSLPHANDALDIDALARAAEPFSKSTYSGPKPFFSLLDYHLCPDFLAGIFLSVFNRRKWELHVSVLEPGVLDDERTYSALDNTFPHLKVFAAAFATSIAWCEPSPMSICLSGAREWAPLYSLVKSVRTVEALQEFRRRGFPRWQYYRARNAALRDALPDLLWMYLNRDRSGFHLFTPMHYLVTNALYPNLYLSPLRVLARRVRQRVAPRRRQSQTPVQCKPMAPNQSNEARFTP